MKVTFFDDYSININEDTKLKTGDILLEFICEDFSDFYLVCDNLIRELDGIAPWEHENTTLTRYSELVNYSKESELTFHKALLSLPFYRVSTPKYLFATNELIREIAGRLKYCKGNTMLADSNFQVNIDWYNTAIESIKRYMNTIFECSLLFKDLAEFCLFEDGISPIDKLNKYGLENIIERINRIENSSYNHFSLEHKIKVINNKSVLIEVYNLTTPSQFLYHDFINLIKNDLRIKKCANCGNLFVVFSGHSLEYCDNIPEGETKPCSVIGSARQYNKKLKSDPILEVYTRSYKTHYSRIRAGHLTADLFKSWSKEAKTMRQKAYNGDISLDEFIDWCKN